MRLGLRDPHGVWRRVMVGVVGTGAICLLPGVGLSGWAQSKPTSKWTPSVISRAHCGPGERTESGLQGHTTQAEQFSSPSHAYNCNLELVGQWKGEGGAWSLTAFDDCAYFSTSPPGNSTGRQYPGVSVVDASDRRRPRGMPSLTTPAMLIPNETVEATAAAKLLAAIQTAPGFVPVPGGGVFELYDISTCSRPTLKASLPLAPGGAWHAAHIAPDGRTYYATSWGGTPAPDTDGFVAIDISDPAKPREILRWRAPERDLAPHWLGMSADGTRMYVGVAGQGRPGGRQNGLAILDIREIQNRRPEPRVRVMSTLYWAEGSIGQKPLPLTIQGKPYLIYMDFGGSLSGGGLRGTDPVKAACAQGLPPHGFARLIDISDERNPVITANILLEVNDPANCHQLITDAASYSGLVCIPDDAQNASLIACAWREAGLRVIDVRNPTHPVEVAYYKSPAVGRAFSPGSAFMVSAGADHTTDTAISPARFDRARGEIWFMSQDNGFQIVRFTDRFRQAHPELFAAR